MIAVIDIGLSNVSSVSKALSVLNVEHVLTSDPAVVATADRLILPGVGSFPEAARRLEATGLRAGIRNAVLERRTPILGICLGMHLLADEGEEHGGAKGLGLVRAIVRKLPSALRLPHVGWNDVVNRGTALLDGTADGDCFYFVHAFAMELRETLPTATCDYGGDFVAVVQKDHIMGTQFHPEKSQGSGLQLLRAFATRVW